MTTARIAYIAGEYPSLSETFVSREVRGLRNRGWEVYAVSLRSPAHPSGEPAANLVAYGPVSFARTWQSALHAPLAASKTLAAAVRDAVAPGEPTALATRLKCLLQGVIAIRIGGDLTGHHVMHLHCHFAHAPTTVGMYVATFLGCGFSFTGHANDLFERRALLKRKITRAAGVVAISHWHADFYRKIEPAITDRCRVVRCGVESASWQPPEKSAQPGIFRIACVGRLVPKKGIGDLIEAVAILRQRMRLPLQLDVVGDGPESDRLRELAQERSLTEGIHWHGALPNEQVRDLLGQASAFALPCRTDGQGDRDGIPVALMEAMSCGVPVVTTDLPTIAELVEPDVTGLIAPPGDTEALANHLQKLAEHPEQAARLGRAGRQRIEHEFDLQANLDRLEALFHQSIRQHAPDDAPEPNPHLLLDQPVSK
jgi:glycosyltransferase involved in cell wall biosynthesis